MFWCYDDEWGSGPALLGVSAFFLLASSPTFFFFSIVKERSIYIYGIATRFKLLDDSVTFWAGLARLDL